MKVLTVVAFIALTSLQTITEANNHLKEYRCPEPKFVHVERLGNDQYYWRAEINGIPIYGYAAHGNPRAGLGDVYIWGDKDNRHIACAYGPSGKRYIVSTDKASFGECKFDWIFDGDQDVQNHVTWWNSADFTNGVKLIEYEGKTNLFAKTIHCK